VPGKLNDVTTQPSSPTCSTPTALCSSTSGLPGVARAAWFTRARGDRLRAEDLKIVSLNTDENRDCGQVRGPLDPTMIVFKDGDVCHSARRARPKARSSLNSSQFSPSQV